MDKVEMKQFATKLDMSRVQRLEALKDAVFSQTEMRFATKSFASLARYAIEVGIEELERRLQSVPAIDPISREIDAPNGEADA